MEKETCQNNKIEEQTPSNPAEEALFRRIAEKSKENPFFGAKIGSRELTHRILSAMKAVEKKVHTESFLGSLGSLAGYACQAALRQQAVAQGFFAGSYFTTVTASDGNTYYFGDHLTRFLVESEYSVWNTVAEGAREAGCSNLPDVAEILRHNAAVLGSPNFGRPRVPDKHQPVNLPADSIHVLWPCVKPLVVKFCPDPEYWPFMVSLSAQEALIMAKSALDPCIGLRIIMESAAAASRIKQSNSYPSKDSLLKR